MKKRKRRRKHRRLLLRFLLLLVLLAVAVVGVYLATHKKQPEKESLITWEEPTLPVIRAQVSGRDMNLMYGYTEEMVDRYMRDTVTPLGERGSLTLKIFERGEKVQKLRYEIRSLDATQLVEDTSVKKLDRKKQKSGSLVTAVLPVARNLARGEEYQLKIFLTIKAHKEISYYTRIVRSDELMTEQMLKFVEEFQEKTMNVKKASGMSAYLKETTDSSGSLAHVTLHSGYRQLLWNYLNPKMVGDPRISLVDINNTIGTFLMNYRVKFKDEDGRSHSCDVEETYTVQISNGHTYMLVYERDVTEGLTLKQVDPHGDRICLGIVHDDKVRMIKSPDGSRQLFSYNGTVWMTDRDENEKTQLKKIFSFHDGKNDLRKLHNEYDSQLVSVSDNGDAAFLVYGYMNQGNHQGAVGMAFYQYSSSKNQAREVFFLPFNRTYAILKQEIGRLVYMTDSGLFYLMLNGNIYAIDFSGMEYMTVVENVSEEALWISDDTTMIAWGESLSTYGAGKVHIFSLEDGGQSTIKAKKGESLNVIGFIGKDLAVGNVKKSQQDRLNNGRYDSLMYSMNILNRYGAICATYEKKGVLLTGAEVENGSVILKRASQSDGRLKAVSDDALIENANQTTVKDELLYKGKTAEGYQIWYLHCDMEEAGDEIIRTNALSVGDSSYLNLDLTSIAEDGMFFAYAKGQLQGIRNSVAECVNLVYDDIGYVTDSNGYYIMRRGYRNVHNLSIDYKDKAASRAESKEIAMKAFAAYEGGGYKNRFEELEKEGLSDDQLLQRGIHGVVYDLTGCKLDQVAYYFMSYSHPLYIELSQGPVLVSGIGSDTVTLWNPLGGDRKTYSLEEIDSLLEKNGSIIFSCMSH